ncbi:ABC transporter substrate-binding protein [Paludibacterium yongneupense]|uniref:ABC transporter substrate-binding protein n=1 Tax=Paludibacterium yongneupense TaxID=400061 RepID=UPI000403FB92|nr:ABC transporter substrate-binding protein [Paludibacterium yongneupense]
MYEPCSVNEKVSAHARITVIAATLLLALGATATALAATPPGVLVIGKAADPQTLDPAVTIDNNDWTVTYPSYQRLLRYKGGSTSVEGDLASSWSSSPDHLSWTFVLKSGQRFDDGTPVTAEAVKQSFERMLKIGQGPADAFPKGLAVSVPKPGVVKFTLPTPFAPFLYTLANDGAAIINPKAVAQNAGDDGRAWLARNTAGSGPFRLVSWQKGQSLVLAPNPYYGGPKPALSKVVVKIIGEASTRRLQLERGDLDIAEELPVDQLEALKHTSGVTVGAYPSLRVTYLYLNNRKSPLSNPALRRAISYATDYDGIIKGVLQGKAKQMRGAIPQGLWGYDPHAMQYGFDLKRAREALDRAGTKPATLSFLYSDRDPNWEPIGLALQANLAKLGITLTMEKLANATMRDRVGKADYDISIGNWSPDFADPYMFMNYWFETAKAGLPGNRAFYTNAQVDAQLVRAATLTDQKQRTQLYQSAQKTIIGEAPYVFLFQKNYEVALRSSVKGFVFNPMLEQVFNLDTLSKH